MLNLGIVYKDSNIINHRSLIKVLLNPLFRFFGFQIGTINYKNKLGGVGLMKCKRTKKIMSSFKYVIEENETLIKKRRII